MQGTKVNADEAEAAIEGWAKLDVFHHDSL